MNGRIGIITFIICVIIAHLFLNFFFSTPIAPGGLGHIGTPIWLPADDWNPFRLILDIIIASFLFSAVVGTFSGRDMQ